MKQWLRCRCAASSALSPVPRLVGTRRPSRHGSARVKPSERRTGYASAAVDYAFDRLFGSLTREAIEAVIAGELGTVDALDGFVASPGRPPSGALPIGRVCIISSRTTIGVAIVPAVFALCAKCSVLVKDREDFLASAFFATVARTSRNASRRDRDSSVGRRRPRARFTRFRRDRCLRQRRDAQRNRRPALVRNAIYRVRLEGKRRLRYARRLARRVKGTGSQRAAQLSI